MGTKLDRSQESGILVTCTDCPYWFAFHWTPAAAHDSACNHDELVHPGRKGALGRRAHHRGLLARNQARHAD